MTLHNFAGLMLCCAVFLVLFFLNPWFAVAFVCAAISFVLFAFCYGVHVIHRRSKSWYKR